MSASAPVPTVVYEAQLPSSATDVYTAPSTGSLAVEMSMFNTDTVTRTVTVWLRPGATNREEFFVSLLTGERAVWTKSMLGASEVIRAQASVASKIDVTIRTGV